MIKTNPPSPEKFLFPIAFKVQEGMDDIELPILVGTRTTSRGSDWRLPRAADLAAYGKRDRHPLADEVMTTLPGGSVEEMLNPLSLAQNDIRRQCGEYCTFTLTDTRPVEVITPTTRLYGLIGIIEGQPYETDDLDEVRFARRTEELVGKMGPHSRNLIQQANKEGRLPGQPNFAGFTGKKLNWKLSLDYFMNSRSRPER